MDGFLALWPAHIVRLGAIHDTNHLIRHRQLGIDSWCKRMNQFRPVVIPQPQHRATVGAEASLGRALLLVRRAAVFDCFVFSWRRQSILNASQKTAAAHLINSFPCLISSVSAIPPRLTLPLYPHTLRQMLQAQSWYGTGVWDFKRNWMPPHWQLPSSSLRFLFSLAYRY